MNKSITKDKEYNFILKYIIRLEKENNPNNEELINQLTIRSYKFQ